MQGTLSDGAPLPNFISIEGREMPSDFLRPQLSRPVFSALFATTFTTAIGNTGLISIMPAVGREIGISDFLIASVFSLSALMWAIASPQWARLSDQQGRKRFILVGLAGFVFSMIGCGFVVIAGLRGIAAPFIIFIAFLVIRSSYGLFGSAAATASQAYVADHTSGPARVRAVAKMAGALSLGTIVGPAISPLLIFPPAGLAGPMFIFALGAVVVAVAVGMSIPADGRQSRLIASVRGKVTGRDVWRNPDVRPFLIFGFIISSAQAANTYTLGFLVIDRLGVAPVSAQGAIGLAMAVGAISGLIAQWGLIALVGMMPRALLRWGAVLTLLGNALIVLLPGYISLVIAFALVNLGYGLARPGFSAGASLAAPDQGQGAVAGAISSIAGASIVVPPIIAVLLYEFVPAAPFILLTGLAAALLVYAWINPALARREPNGRPIVS
jgi:MFS family permease